MNVKFYQLAAADFRAWSNSYEGVFVHLTSDATVSGTTYKSGLWFGGHSGWEYLTNDPAAITAAINALDVSAYAQGSIAAENDVTPTSSELKIFGIKEVDGKISHESTSDLTINIDGVYNASTNKLATQSTVSSAITNAIEGLDTSSDIEIVVGESLTPSGTDIASYKYTFKKINEADGVIAQGSNDDVLYLKTQQSISNPIVTQSDIANLAGAMHYQGSLEEDNDWPTEVEAGDVYMVTTGFTHGTTVLEAGDMVVFGSTTLTDYKVVQSNMTLGTGSGQVATNDGPLTSGKIVVATGSGISTSGYDVTDLASQATTVATASGLGSGESGVTITDTLTVGGTAQTGQVVTLKSANDAIAVSSSGNTITLAHNTITAATASTTGTITFTHGSATFTTYEDTFDAQGHIGTKTTKTWTITLPTSGVDSTDATINGEAGYSQIVVNHDNSDEEVHLSSKIKIGVVGSATVNSDGLATAYAVQQYCANYVNSITGSNSVSVTPTTDSDTTGASFGVDLVWLTSF